MAYLDYELIMVIMVTYIIYSRFVITFTTFKKTKKKIRFSKIYHDFDLY